MSRAHHTVAALVVLVSVSACGQARTAAAPPPNRRRAGRDRAAGRQVRSSGDRVRRGSTVIFRNGDTDAHTVTSVPNAPTAFNVTIAPGRSAVLTFDRVGIYRYFCSLHARYDPSTDQVAALPTADRPNEPMEGGHRRELRRRSITVA
jgi:plastocyanin